MKKLFYLLSLVLVGAIVIFSAGCSDDDDDAAGITQDQIVGTWIGFYDTVFEGPNGADCDAIFFDLDVAGNIKILSFLGGEPAAGHIGTYSIKGNELVLNLTHDWAEELEGADYLNWVEALYEVAIYAAISSDGNVLTAGPSEEEAWQLNKIELSDIDDGFIGDWFDDGTDGLWKINTSGSYDYSEPDYSESGQLEQFTYDGNTYFLANTTYTSDVDGACDAYFVCRVALNGAEDEMTIWYGDYEIVYTPAIQQQQIAGTWIGFYDTVFEGPNGADCDAIFFDLDNAGNIKILSFLGGEPAAGHKGTYSIKGDELVLNLTHDWEEELEGADYLNWVEAPYEAAIYVAISSDGNVLTAGPSEEEAWQLNKIVLSDLDDGFIGDWFDDETDGLWKINSPTSYEYTEASSYSDSGDLEQFSYIDDNTYFLANTTTSSDVGGACDAYFVCRVALNGAEDEMTIWFGEYEMVYTLMP